MRDALREVNGLYLRLNLSFFTLYWIGVLLLTLFPILIYWICLSIVILMIDVLLLEYTSGVSKYSFFFSLKFFYLFINNILSLIKKNYCLHWSIIAWFYRQVFDHSTFRGAFFYDYLEAYLPRLLLDQRLILLECDAVKWGLDLKICGKRQMAL